MKNLTYCLSKVVYHLDLDSLPLKQGESKIRPRTQTTSSETKYSKKPQKTFTDIKPSVSPERTELTKAMTFDVQTSSADNSPNGADRRNSTPARTTPLSNLSASSALVTRREISRQQTVIEEEPTDILSVTNDDENKTLLRAESPKDLDNLHSSLVISNEDVSSGKEEDFQTTADHTPNLQMLKRSMSESLSLSVLTKPTVRPLSPDLLPNQKPSESPSIQVTQFTEFFPKPLTTPSPPSAKSPSPKLASSLQESQIIRRGRDVGRGMRIWSTVKNIILKISFISNTETKLVVISVIVADRN